MAKRWKKADLTYLKRYASRRRLADIAERFKTDAETVEAKLTEMGVAAKDMVVAPNLAEDPNVKLFERALKAVHQSKWADGAKILEQVISDTDLPELAQSARRYLDVCKRELNKAAETPDDPFLEAVYERNRGNFAQALELCEDGDRQSKDERFAYLAAAIHAVQGDLSKSGEFLGVAIELNERNRVVASRDEDFDGLRLDPEYSSLFASA